MITSGDFWTRIEPSHNCIVTTHVNPDADALGSACGLMHVLRALGKNVVVVNSSPTPANLQFLPGVSDVELYAAPVHDALINRSDVIVCVDLNTPSRVGEMQSVIRSNPSKVIMVDHHEHPDAFFTTLYHDPQATSTAELIYRLLVARPDELLSEMVATNLYAGLVSDTGNYRFPRVTSTTFEIAAHLVRAGADPVYVCDCLYNSWSLDRMRLYGEVLASAQLYHDGKLCILQVTREMLVRHSCTEEVLEGIVQNTLGIEGVRCGVLLSERDTEREIKASLRSKGDFAVNTIAATFGGGGHFHAAGARLRDSSLAHARQIITDAIGRALGYQTES